jgi:hypothetical protein
VRRKKGELPEGCRDLWQQFILAGPETQHDSAHTFFYAVIHCLRYRRANLTPDDIARLIRRDAPRATHEDAAGYAIAYAHIMAFSDLRKNQLWQLYGRSRYEEDFQKRLREREAEDLK